MKEKFACVCECVCEFGTLKVAGGHEGVGLYSEACNREDMESRQIFTERTNKIALMWMEDVFVH